MNNRGKLLAAISAITFGIFSITLFQFQFNINFNRVNEYITSHDKKTAQLSKPFLRNNVASGVTLSKNGMVLEGSIQLGSNWFSYPSPLMELKSEIQYQVKSLCFRRRNEVLFAFINDNEDVNDAFKIKDDTLKIKLTKPSGDLRIIPIQEISCIDFKVNI